jgi:predicted TIM-barrel fold metal-dependent hydrolase
MNDHPHRHQQVMPSNHIMWSSDLYHAEGIYAATEFTRRCLAEALVEKIIHGDLTEEEARHIGRQIMWENALSLFPRVRTKLWRTEDQSEPPAGHE